MDSHSFAWLVFAGIATFVSARAVNISNTWMLPEEGFPVFYRYFRDRISWYEADAVCQFHHANLVTADSSSQYDAIRAYLKELDITESIWIGLSKTTEKSNFLWTDFRPLNGEGHWQQSIPKGNDSLCVVMNPAADFLWTPLTCGGPDVASFICELPVPSWAMGPKGCLLTELPSLTVLYIPEQLALELTSDCGLDGTKRIACKGNANREDILKQLTCAMPPDDFDDKSTKSPLPSSTQPELSSEYNVLNSKTTKPWIWTSNTIDIDYGMPTRHRRETEDTISPVSTKSTTDLSVEESQSNNKFTTAIFYSHLSTDVTSISPEKDVTLDFSTYEKGDKISELQNLHLVKSTTLQINNYSDEEVEHGLATEDSKSSNSALEDVGEYPSAIGQGQLFSIIENGTMFDVIELNDTTSEDEKFNKDLVETPQSESEAMQAVTIKYTEENYSSHAITSYNKKAQSVGSIGTSSSIKKEKHPKKHQDSKKIKIHNMKDKMTSQNISNALENKQFDKTLSKEVEMFPIMTDSLVRLNRTYRKELPLSVADEESSVNEKSSLIASKIPNFSTNTIMNNENHQHVEIKWHESGKNLTQTSLFITTKRLDAVSEIPIKEEMELLSSDEDGNEALHPIDSKINLLNNNNVTENNDSESFVPPKPEKIKTVTAETTLVKERYLPKSLLGETSANVDTSDDATSSTESSEPEPQAQPRPNRQRQLTRPQKRSFYQNFFSRVLG